MDVVVLLLRVIGGVETRKWKGEEERKECKERVRRRCVDNADSKQSVKIMVESVYDGCERVCE